MTSWYKIPATPPHNETELNTLASAVSRTFEKGPSADHLTWKAFRNGSEEAFEMLYYHYFHELFYKSRKICADNEMIRDCIHDLFLEIWEKRMHLSIPHSVHAYLQSSVRRRLVRCIREKRSREKRLIFPEIITHSIEDKLIKEQTKLNQSRLVILAVSGLTKRQRKALSLKFYSGMSYSDIAMDMGISKRSVYNMIAKAISRLHYHLISSDLNR